MSEAERDNNWVPVMLGVSNADGVTPAPVHINPVTNKIKVEVADESASPTVGTRITRDDNRVPVGSGVSTVDGVTPVPLHTTTEGKVLADIA